jgi:hypothetical protein
MNLVFDERHYQYRLIEKLQDQRWLPQSSGNNWFPSGILIFSLFIKAPLLKFGLMIVNDPGKAISAK